MSNVECPSQAWDRHIAGEEDAADAAMAMEEEVLKEVGEPALSFFHTLPENVLSDIIQTAHKKGYAQAGKDRIDAKSVYEFEQELERADKQYKVVCFMRIDTAELRISKGRGRASRVYATRKYIQDRGGRR